MTAPLPAAALDRETLRRTAEQLAGSDPALRRVLRQLGPPPMWGRPANYGTIVRIILEQNVSLAAAKSTFNRLRAACGRSVTAAAVLRLGPDRLRELGFSRQKTRYTVTLAEDVRTGRFPIAPLRRLADDEVRQRITSRLGLGDWTADIFLLMALRRPDVFPLGDLALLKGLGELDGTEYASGEEVLRRADRWRPYRAVAARMIWQLYLHNRGRKL